MRLRAPVVVATGGGGEEGEEEEEVVPDAGTLHGLSRGGPVPGEGKAAPEAGTQAGAQAGVRPRASGRRAARRGVAAVARRRRRGGPPRVDAPPRRHLREAQQGIMRKAPPGTRKSANFDPPLVTYHTSTDFAVSWWWPSLSGN